MSNAKKLFWIFFPLIAVGIILGWIFGSWEFWLEYFTVIIVIVIVSSIFSDDKQRKFRRNIIYVIVIFFAIFEVGKFMKIHWPMTLAGIFEYKTNRDMENYTKMRSPETGTQIMLLKQFGEANKARTVVLKDSVQYYLKKQSFGPLSSEDSTKLANWIKEGTRFNKQAKSLLNLAGADSTNSEAESQVSRVDTVKVYADKPLSPSPFYVQRGEKFKFRVVGKWNCAIQGSCQPGPCTAAGQNLPDCANYIGKYPGGTEKVHNLLVYVGNRLIKDLSVKVIDDNTIEISGIAPETGAIYFGINDYFLRDNAGFVLVIGNVTRA